MEQVEEVGRPAHCPMRLASDAAGNGHLRQEYVFEDGYVWLILRHGDRLHSMRRPMPQEVPQSGWRHEDDCACRYCAAPD